MYNEQLEQLIDAALADGVLTEKEKQILFKKAQTFGIDLDEFEMVLDARLVKLQKEQQAAAPKSNKYADVKKCPACGSIIPPNTKVCPGCGMVFANDQEDIKEISQIYDNYVKISSENAKFPLGYIYISGFILVTLINVFAWVYAIACEYLVGLPILSTILWIAAIRVYFKLENKTYTVFGEKYHTAVAKHINLYSTAKAFYAQDKNTLNRINDIALQVDKVVADKNKTKIIYNAISFGILGLTIILSLALSFGWFYNALLKENSNICCLAIKRAIESNKMDKAEFYADLSSYNDAYILLLDAYIIRDDEAKVLEYYYKCCSEERIANYYVAKNQHQSAVDAASKCSLADVYECLEICVKDFMKKGNKSDALKFIKTNSYLFNGEISDSEYYKPKVVKELTQLTKE